MEDAQAGKRGEQLTADKDPARAEADRYQASPDSTDATHLPPVLRT